jgi:hypothetical protein
MELSRRRGFPASPRLVFPLLALVVLAMFFVFRNLGGQDITAERIAATAVAGAALLILFGLLAIAARVRRRTES